MRAIRSVVSSIILLSCVVSDRNKAIFFMFRCRELCMKDIF